MSNFIEETKEKIALSCRILAMKEISDGTTGHVSVRPTDDNKMIIRCRTLQESGIAYTTSEMIKCTDFNGVILEKGEDVEVPNEYVIHAEIYKKNPEVKCVIHVHPLYTLLCGISKVEILPVIGGYDPEMLKIAAKGVPVYNRSITLVDKGNVNEMIHTMGSSEICILRGHGVVVTGETIEETTIKTIRLENLAHICWELFLNQSHTNTISDEDIQYFNHLFEKRREKYKQNKPSHNEWLWRSLIKSLPDD